MQVVTQPSHRSAEVQRLRAQLERVQGRKLDEPVIPVHPALAALLPGGGLRPGSAYTVQGGSSLLLGLMVLPSQTGSWCGVVGMPLLGMEAAKTLGINLARMVLIPEPGVRWLAVTATIADALPVVAVRPRGPVSNGDVSRLAARLRERGAVLLVDGAWPHAEASITITARAWRGLGRGHGYLAARTVEVTATSRRWSQQRHLRVDLPDARGSLSVAPARVGEHHRGADTVPLSAVG